MYHMEPRLEERKIQHQKDMEEKRKKAQEAMGSTASSEESRLVPARQQSLDYSPWFFPRRWMLPTLFDQSVGEAFDDKLKRLDLYQHGGDAELIRLQDDDFKFEISLGLHDYRWVSLHVRGVIIAVTTFKGHFRPEEVEVKVENGVLIVDASHETKSNDGSVVSRAHFHRSYTLPKECDDASKVTANASSDGVLVITAPKKKKAIQQQD